MQSYFLGRNPVKRILFLLFWSFMLTIFLGSCASKTTEEIEREENPTVRLLKIRKLVFNKRYRLAETMYKQVQADYPLDKALQVEVDYEIAFLYVKREKYKAAKPLFEAIINRYELDEESNQLPQWPYYLSQKILYDVVEVELNKPPFWHVLIPPRWRNNLTNDEVEEDA